MNGRGAAHQPQGILVPATKINACYLLQPVVSRFNIPFRVWANFQQGNLGLRYCHHPANVAYVGGNRLTVNRHKWEGAARRSQQVLERINHHGRRSGASFSTQLQGSFNERRISGGDLKTPDILQTKTLKAIESNVVLHKREEEKAGPHGKDVTDD